MKTKTDEEVANEVKMKLLDQEECYLCKLPVPTREVLTMHNSDGRIPCQACRNSGSVAIIRKKKEGYPERVV